MAMRNRLLKKVSLMLLFSYLVMFASCAHLSETSGKKEAKKLYEYLVNSGSLKNLELWEISEFGDAGVELSFRGSCDLKTVFIITETTNKYLEETSKCFFNSAGAELWIKVFPEDSSKYDASVGNWFACVAKGKEEHVMTDLRIHSNDVIYLSGFRDCRVPYKCIELTYNTVFDDYESLFLVNGLQEVFFTCEYGFPKEENFVQVLEHICYYEDHNIVVPFKFVLAIPDELEDAYSAFLLSHGNYSTIIRSTRG